MVRSSGPSPFRVLLFGGGPAVGYGVLSHDLALAGHLARGLQRATGFGIDVDVVTQVDLRCREMPALLADVDLERYDMVVLSVGVQDVLDVAPLAEWSAAVERLLDLLCVETQRPRPVCVIAVPETSSVLRMEPLLAKLADQRCADFNTRLTELCATRPGMIYVPFTHVGEAVPCRERALASYRQWAEPMVEIMAPSLELVRDRAVPHREELARQAALDKLDLGTDPDEVFDSITRSARRIFKTLGAGISLVDNDRQWFKSISGAPVPVLPRGDGLCNLAIQTNHGFFVEDALHDQRLAGSFFATVAKLRSYAGIPIRDPSGHMIGALCIFDDKPRQFSSEEIALLRSLAHLVEQRLLVAA
ncbi:MAG TPA: GAF domain-containing protein [Pseudolysinimonas sp.]|nr:GAF domain-containing protein [Pseudolysinimonas sp.]